MSNFWESKLGKIIRWALYIPVGLIFLELIKILSILFLVWFFGDMKGFLIIGILFGGVAFIWFAGFLYYLSILLISACCPAPKKGMLVFGTLYYLLSIYVIISYFQKDQRWEIITVSVLSTIVCAIIAFFGFHKAIE